MRESPHGLIVGQINENEIYQILDFEMQFSADSMNRIQHFLYIQKGNLKAYINAGAEAGAKEGAKEGAKDEGDKENWLKLTSKSGFSPRFLQFAI
jgi:hypothetical protein